MATGQLNRVLQHLRRAALPRDGAGMTDGQLLECFVDRRDEAALEALVRRHGPMAWGVCRRVLRNHHDAEDAFQATFLVLVRRAASIVPRDMVANWLYGVAHQTALQARRTTARRGAREKQVAQMPEPAAAEQHLCDDLRPLLDQALSRLPDKYRVAVVLCDLEGKTRKEAARQLGLPEGTVASRLTRARAMLAKRLARHGLAISGGALAAVLSPDGVSAGVPASVVASALEAASRLAAGQAAAGAIPVKVAALTEGVIKAMWLTKLKTVTAALLVIMALTAVAGLICPTRAAERPEARAATRQAENDKPPAAGKRVAKTDLDRLQGVWKLEYVEVSGRAQKMEYYKKTRLVIKGDKLTLRSNDGRVEIGSVRVDSTKRPKEIDMISRHPAGHLMTDPGIYKLNGDKLTICYAPHLDAGQERPTEFETAKEGGRLWVLVRAPREKAAGKGDK
jgi:RNA polymerase sigma factor (sigma-70 family)